MKVNILLCNSHPHRQFHTENIHWPIFSTELIQNRHNNIQHYFFLQPSMNKVCCSCQLFNRAVTCHAGLVAVLANDPLSVVCLYFKTRLKFYNNYKPHPPFQPPHTSKSFLEKAVTMYSDTKSSSPLLKWTMMFPSDAKSNRASPFRQDQAKFRADWPSPHSLFPNYGNQQKQRCEVVFALLWEAFTTEACTHETTQYQCFAKAVGYSSRGCKLPVQNIPP